MREDDKNDKDKDNEYNHQDGRPYSDYTQQSPGMWLFYIYQFIDFHRSRWQSAGLMGWGLGFDGPITDQ